VTLKSAIHAVLMGLMDTICRVARASLWLLTHGFHITGILVDPTMEGSLTTMPFPFANQGYCRPESISKIGGK